MRSDGTLTTIHLWGLWLLFTFATIGFVVFFFGLLGKQEGQTQFGVALLTFSVLTWLFFQLWSASRSANRRTAATLAGAVTGRPIVAGLHTPAASMTPDSAAAPGQNFEHLLGHTLEHVVAPEPPLRDAPATGVGRALTASIQVTNAEAGPVPARYQKDYFVHAVKRRSEMVQTLPNLRTILDEGEPVTNAQHPGKTRGQCSGCDAVLWAPAVRPIRIRCPRCSKTAWLGE